jgi:hypothetical protein
VKNIPDVLLIKTTKRIRNIRLSAESTDLSAACEGIDKLISEGGEIFFRYVEGIGLAKETGLLVLSSTHNYFYDAEEIFNTTTIINLKELNQIKQIQQHLQSFLNILPKNGNFVGCFVDNRKIERYSLRYNITASGKRKRHEDIENSIVSPNPLINWLYSLMDFRPNLFMSESSVTSMLDYYGFQVMDMTDYNGLTYFHAQKSGKSYNYIN